MDDREAVSKIMTRDVVQVRSEARLEEAARLMREYHVSGLPVVEEGGKVVGIISEVDLVRGLHQAVGVGSPRGLLDLLLESTPAKGPTLFELCRRRLSSGRVKDLMSHPATCIDQEEPIREAARLMNLNRINRLPVVDDERRLAGIVTRRDLVDAVSGEPPQRVRGAMHPAPMKTPKAKKERDVYSDI